MGSLAAKKNKETGAVDSTEPESLKRTTPRCLAIALKGIQTANDFAFLMSALMSDVVEGTITPNVCNAAVNAGGKLLKVVDMQMKYGTQGKGQEKVLRLVTEQGDKQ